MNSKVQAIAEQIKEAGGQMFIVGGAVRDAVRGVTPKDFDFMVAGISKEQVMEIVSHFGVIEVADAISNAPVFIASIDGISVEIAMARIEKDIAPGKHGFEFISHPGVTPEEDMIRRDFTIGAIFQDVITGEIFDPFGGISDIKQGIIRHVDAETFVQSPERAFRAMSQAARFGFVIASETIVCMNAMKKDFHTIPAEQIWRHIEKAGESPKEPSRFILGMFMSGWDEFFPEIHGAEAIGVMWDNGCSNVVEFVAAMIAGMSFMEEQSFFAKICCPKAIAKAAVEVKHFGKDGKPVAWVNGRDIAHVMQPGVQMGVACRWAFVGQINGMFEDKAAAVAWVEETFKE